MSKNASRSINDIAKSLGFSRQKVLRIVKNLEKNNAIWGYAAVVDQEKVNRKGYMLIMKRLNKPFSEESINKIINRNLTEQVKKLE